MHVLALDTTTRAGSAALIDDDRIVDERGGDETRTHALRLPAEILDLALAHQRQLSDIDLYAVASGPGSFTGLRIGIATIQGLASVHGRRVVAVSALEALAHVAGRDAHGGALVAAWMDARRHDVFAALYRVTEARPFTRARLAVVEAPTVGSPGETLARWRTVVPGFSAAFIGDGAVLYASVILRDEPDSAILPMSHLAGTIGLLAAERASEALDPAAVRPLYVRRTDVELARDARAAAADDCSQGG
jgi:tRNA threonylcarbamoyladenosine biosynthesis protein TsaB